MSEPVSRFTVSIPPELLETFDAVCASKGYSSRSEAVRDAVRGFLIEQQWTSDGSSGEVLATIVLQCDPQTNGLPSELHLLLADGPGRILSSQRVYVDSSNFLETIVARGTLGELHTLASSLISLKGVKHGQLVRGSTGSPR
jgi:CopG family nickel-responsive transcriptional regulator